MTKAGQARAIAAAETDCVAAHDDATANTAEQMCGARGYSFFDVFALQDHAEPEFFGPFGALVEAL